MPRVLPWLKDEASSKGRQQNSSAGKKRRIELADNVVDTDLNDTSTSVIPHRNATRVQARSRSPSTSPPPAPPDIEYMIEGYAADDRWMMVEDEFATVAHLFTNHIHHAEYVRLKKLAKSKGEEALRNITYPTDGRAVLSKDAQLQHEVATNAMRNDTILHVQSEGETEAQASAWHSNKTLSALMLQKDGRDKDLRNIARRKVNTRAAAGYSQSPHNRIEKKPRVQWDQSDIKEDSDDVDDDLDYVAIRESVRKDRSNLDAQDDSTNEVRDAARIGRSNILQRYAASERVLPEGERISQIHDSSVGVIERDTAVQNYSQHPRLSLSPSHPSRTLKVEKPIVKEEPVASVSEVQARRKARRERREKEQRDKVKHEKSLQRFDEIPTFMIN